MVQWWLGCCSEGKGFEPCCCQGALFEPLGKALGSSCSTLFILIPHRGGKKDVGKHLAIFCYIMCCVCDSQCEGLAVQIRGGLPKMFVMLSNYYDVHDDECSLIKKHFSKPSAEETVLILSRATTKWRLVYQFGCALKCRMDGVLPAGVYNIVPDLVVAYQPVIAIIGQIKVMLNLWSNLVLPETTFI